MKTFNVLVVALAFVCHASAADVLTEKLQRGLFEEEANHNLDAAIKEYQSVVLQSDEQRKVTATALFRLGECYRKLGRTNEANAQYQRILRDFSEQEQLARLANDLMKPASAAGGNQSELVDQLKTRVATLRVESITQQMEADRLARLGLDELSNSDVVKNDSIFSNLRLQGLALVQKSSALKAQFSNDHPEVRAVNEQLKKLQEQISERIVSIVKSVQDRANSLAAQLKALDAELKKTQATALVTGQTEVAPTDEEEKEVRRIQAMIKDSPDLINARVGGTETPLHRATSAGQLVVARFLLENKADVNAKNSVSDIPLHLAAIRGHKSMVELLLDHGADVNAMAANGTPLHYAAGFGFRAVVEVLLARQAEVNARTAYGRTPLHSAVGNGHKAVVELLLDKGADLNAATTDGWVALHMAANAMNKPIAELLVARGARIDVTRDDGQTPLSVATAMKSAPVAEILLASKANPNIPDKTGTTPLSYAVQKASLELVNLLLAHGADPNLGDRSAVMPLHWAIIYGEAAMVEALLKNKAAPDPKITWGAGTTAPTYRTPQNQNANFPNGATPLWLAVDRQQVKVADLLLSFGAPINARVTTTVGGSISYSTLLEIAVSSRDKNMVKLLLERKADPNVPVVNNNLTPLMIATAYRSREIVELLLDHGAEVNILSANGATPLSIAQNQWGSSPASPEIAELLLKHGAIEDLQRAASITVARGGVKYQVFQKDTNSLNRFNLFEALAQHYAPGLNSQNYFLFPDFARVKVRSLRSKAGEKENIVDLESAFQFTNCAPNTWLEWGDLIELPEQDHVVNVPWFGLSVSAKNTLKQCLRKQVRIVVKGQTNLVILTPELVEFAGYGVPMLSPSSLQRVINPGVAGAGIPGAAIVSQSDSPPQIELTFQRLNDVVRAANVIRSSSDLTRVKVKRTSGAASEQKEMMFDLIRLDKTSDLWLRDGDVIEIPEKQ